MRSRQYRLAIPSLLAVLGACTDLAGPRPQDLVDVFLDFCAAETPVFFAIQNERTRWQRVLPDAEGTFRFRAAPRFTLAFVRQHGPQSVTEYVFATPDDIAPLSGVSCVEQTGTKTLHGSVSGVASGSATMVSLGGSFSYVEPPATTFTLANVPPAAPDLIAHREVLTSRTTVTPDRVIIRRAQDRTHGSTFPVLDFGASEAQNSATHGFTVSGLSAFEDNYFLLTFSTRTTRRHPLSTVQQFTTGAQTIYGIPSSLTQPDDLHELEVYAGAAASYRGEIQFYRAPSTRGIALGAQLSTPTLTTVSSTPHVRLRTRLPSQPDYGTFISVAYEQPSRHAVVTATKSYFGGTPVTWDVTMPDASAIAGFPADALLQTGQSTEWYVDAYGGSETAAAFLGAAKDGAVLRVAGRSFTASVSMASRMRGEGGEGGGAGRLAPPPRTALSRLAR